MGDLARFFERTAGRQNNSFVSHINQTLNSESLALVHPTLLGMGSRKVRRESELKPEIERRERNATEIMSSKLELTYSVNTQIKFGTSGWRAVMADDFTFANVQRALHGIARYVASQKGSGARVIVGRDPRFLGETFCEMADEILSSYGIAPVIIAEPAPTPAISYAVIQSKADGAINFTASHNPPEYNGIKFSTPDGAPSLPEVTKAIESQIAAYDDNPKPPQAKKAEAQSIDPRSMYFSRLREIVDFDVIKKSGMKVAFDPMWGAARGYSDALLRDAGIAVVNRA